MEDICECRHHYYEHAYPPVDAASSAPTIGACRMVDCECDGFVEERVVPLSYTFDPLRDGGSFK